jgi:hypothetical protein
MLRELLTFGLSWPGAFLLVNALYFLSEWLSERRENRQAMEAYPGIWGFKDPEDDATKVPGGDGPDRAED